MLHPHFLFALSAFLLSTFVLRPAFSASEADGGQVMVAKCQVKSMDGKTIDSERSFKVVVQDVNDSPERVETTMLTVTNHAIGTDARRTHILDIEVFQQNYSNERTYRSTVYQKEGFMAGVSYKTLGANEFVSKASDVRLRHYDYSLKKQFDCQLTSE